jgi:hypothetical protein
MNVISAIYLLFQLEAGILVIIWFVTIPGIVANRRGSPRALAIGALGIFGTIFFGIGWIAALVWALVEPVQPRATRPLTTLWICWLAFPPVQFAVAFAVTFYTVLRWYV